MLQRQARHAAAAAAFLYKRLSYLLVLQHATSPHIRAAQQCNTYLPMNKKPAQAPSTLTFRAPGRRTPAYMRAATAAP
jgi:hypothetical protein